MDANAYANANPNANADAGGSTIALYERCSGELKIGDQIAQKKKKKKKKKSLWASFSSVQFSFFGPIRNMLFRVKQTISTFVCMQDFSK